MKKFFLGLFCGFLLSTVSVVSASESIKTFLSKASLAFYVNGTITEANPGDIDLLNYKDRLYVPIRYFSEQMGATIDYLPATDKVNVPHVVITYEDKKNFTVTDATESIRISHVSVDFGQIEDSSTHPPTITGIVTVDKLIPKGKEAVIELKDKNGNVIAQSEFMTAGGYLDRRDTRGISLNEFKVGDVRPFKVYFPYVSAIKEYQVDIKIVDSTNWRFKQDGSFAQEDYPINVSLGTNHPLSEPIRKGSTLKIRLLLTNTSEREIKIISAPFEIDLPGNKKIVPEVLTNTVIPGNHGALQIVSEWKADVDPGQYFIRIKEPMKFQYEENGILKDYYGFGNMWSAFPITVK